MIDEIVLYMPRGDTLLALHCLPLMRMISVPYVSEAAPCCWCYAEQAIVYYVPRSGSYPFMLCKADLSFMWEEDPWRSLSSRDILSLLSRCDPSKRSLLASLLFRDLTSCLRLRKSLYVPHDSKPIFIAPLGTLDRRESKSVNFLEQDCTPKYLQRFVSNICPDRI